MKQIDKLLFEKQDKKYASFSAKLIPNIDDHKIIGVRTPDLRTIAKNIKDEDYIEEFLNTLPHKTQEENLLHGMILSMKYKDIDILLKKLDEFLIYADNWAVTDMISPKIFKKYPDKVYQKIIEWLKSDSEYVIRFAIVSLLQFYLDTNFNKDELVILSKVRTDYFYVNMALAWFYSFALIKQYDSTILYFENKVLDSWIHNKSLQKAIESYRISDERKKYLRSLKINVKKSK